MKLTLSRSFALATTLILVGVAVVWAIPGDTPTPDAPKVAEASDEGEQAIAGFKKPAGSEVRLFAAEPDVANPVAFYVDDAGKVWVCETFRQKKGVEDNRSHSNWVDDDLAAQTLEDRAAYFEKHLGEKLGEYTKHDDRIRLLVDENGDGKADKATVFADGFNSILHGTGAGVLEYNDKVFYTCIPDLYLLSDEDNDGKADQRKSLHTGFGIRVAFRGHDMHGLTLGPDGRVYFSIGDRGFNVKANGRQYVNPNSGAVFRCELDGSNFEVVATGLRNPQELAFDDFGNLFTGDNNSDSGDKARWVYVVPGSDSGWRMEYQYLSDRGPWNREKLWHPQHEGQAAYIVPPITNISDGPSGLDYYPGTGWGDQHKGKFFLCDFRGGAANSGIRTFRNKPKGAFFELTDSEQPFWNILATDAQFGPDGSLYVSDWVHGWDGLGKGRLYAFSDPEHANSELVKETQKLLKEGFVGREKAELAGLLSHADQRVRLRSQYALAEKNAFNEFAEVVRKSDSELARVHAIWGIGQLARRRESLLQTLGLTIELLNDEDAEIRAQAAKLAGDALIDPATDRLIELVSDENARVRAFAAMALGRIGAAKSAPAILEMLTENNNEDPIVRHAGIMALAGIGDTAKIAALAKGQGPAVRLAVVVALRKLGGVEVADFLTDPDQLVTLEAARAVYDTPIEAGMPALAELASLPLTSEPLLWRSLAANYHLGDDAAANRVAEVAARESTPEKMRHEALKMLATWAEPAPRDRVLGMWRPTEKRSANGAANAINTSLASLLADEAIRSQAISTAAALGLKEIAPELQKVVADKGLAAKRRADALKALAGLKHETLQSAIDLSLKSNAPQLRAAAVDVIAAGDEKQAFPLLAKAIASDSTFERQQAFATLSKLKLNKADALLTDSMQKLLKGDVPADTRLDVVLAASARNSTDLAKLVKEYQQTRQSEKLVDNYTDALYGGDAERGRELFFGRAKTSCVRCHKIAEQGGQVGPELTHIAKDKKPEYLLEAIVDPNGAIAKGFESVAVINDEGRVITGIVKKETDTHLTLMDALGALLVIDKETIEARKAGKSSMPEDLKDHMTKKEIRDLVAYLTSLQ